MRAPTPSSTGSGGTGFGPRNERDRGVAARLRRRVLAGAGPALLVSGARDDAGGRAGRVHPGPPPGDRPLGVGAVAILPGEVDPGRRPSRPPPAARRPAPLPRRDEGGVARRTGGAPAGGAKIGRAH